MATVNELVFIDGIPYQVPVIGIERQAPILDRRAERTEDGDLDREVIGTFYNHTIAFGSTDKTDEYAALFEKLTEPVPFHTIVVPGSTGMYTYIAYIADAQDKLRRVARGDNYWNQLSARFIAKKPARLA